MSQGKRAAGQADLFRRPRVEKNRRFVLRQFKGKGAKKLNISFAPLEKL